MNEDKGRRKARVKDTDERGRNVWKRRIVKQEEIIHVCIKSKWLKIRRRNKRGIARS